MTNQKHDSSFLVSRDFRSASGYLGSVRCLAIIRHFILTSVGRKSTFSMLKYVSAFLCYSKVLQYKTSVYLIFCRNSDL